MKQAYLKVLGLTLGICLVSCGVVYGQNVVTDWGAIAENSIVNVAQISPAASPVYMSYVQAAVYNAVNSIDGRHQPFLVTPTSSPEASQQSAAIAAAHRALVRLFPGQQASLDAAYALSIAAVPDDISKAEGVAAGVAAADQLLDARAGDGLAEPVSVTLGNGPGAWQPTAPAPPAAPWMAQFKPFTFGFPAEFRPDEGPTPLDSSEWAGDYNRTRLYGAKDGSLRTPGQTEIGRFWSDHTQKQYDGALRGLVETYRLNISDSARLYAMANVAVADALVGCMEAKYHFMFWRPVTAIHLGDTDGNPDTTSDPLWQPLVPTPNHPEYPANHGCATSAFVTTLNSYFGSDFVDIAFRSNVTGTTHVFHRLSDVLDEVEKARIYGGMHYHHSIVQGAILGRKVARNMLANNFLPLE